MAVQALLVSAGPQARSDIASSRLAGTSILAAALCCASTLSNGINAQSIVVPAFTRTHPDQLLVHHTHVASTARLLPCRTQYGYAVADFKIAKGMLQSVGFRPPQFVKLFFYYVGGWYNPQVTLGLDVSMSHGASLPLAFGRTFAANHGTDLTIVFSGQVTWPRWELKDDDTKFLARIPFQRPFPFDAAKGRSVVLDVSTRTSTGTGYPDEWAYDVVAPDYGGMLAKPNVPLTPNCHPGPISRPFQLSLYPGGAWSTAWKVPSPPSGNRLAIVSIGLTGSGGKWGSLDLPFVLPGTNCVWGVASVLFWSFSLDANGYGAIPPLPIPNVQAVVGLRFFDQCAVLVPNVNTLGVLTLPSAAWGIGTTRTPQAATVFLTNDSGQSEGGMFGDPQVARVEFTYQ